MAAITRHTREDLKARRRELLDRCEVESFKDLRDIAGMRELTTEEEAALEELRRIEFLLGEE